VSTSPSSPQLRVGLLWKIQMKPIFFIIYTALLVACVPSLETEVVVPQAQAELDHDDLEDSEEDDDFDEPGDDFDDDDDDDDDEEETEEEDTDPVGGGDSGSECNRDNEDCRPGTCGGDSVNMLPGSDCAACHSLSIAGTVFSDIDGTNGVSGATVRVVDANGDVTELHTTGSGNFFTQRHVEFPAFVEVERDGNVIEMFSEINHGACNTCHVCDDEGKVYAP
jgi:hypothetical protein